MKMLHIKSNLLCLVCQCVVSVLFALYFSLRDNMIYGVRVAWLVGHSNSNEGGAGLCEGSFVVE